MWLWGCVRARAGSPGARGVARAARGPGARARGAARRLTRSIRKLAARPFRQFMVRDPARKSNLLVEVDVESRKPREPAILGRASRVLLPERPQDRSETSDHTHRRGGRCLRRRGPRADRGAATGRRGDPRSRRDVRVGARGPVRGAVAGARDPLDGRRGRWEWWFSDRSGPASACPGLSRAHEILSKSNLSYIARTTGCARPCAARAPPGLRRRPRAC